MCLVGLPGIDRIFGRGGDLQRAIPSGAVARGARSPRRSKTTQRCSALVGGAYIQFRSVQYDELRGAAAITGELKSKVDRVWDAFWSGGISNPLEVIEQITYLLFVRRLDDLETLTEKKARVTGKAEGLRFGPTRYRQVRRLRGDRRRSCRRVHRDVRRSQAGEQLLSAVVDEAHRLGDPISHPMPES